MLLHRIYDEQLAQAGYLVGSSETGDALVVDPNRDVERYLALAAAEDLRIAAVTETHIHADFVSGARELAQRTGARLYLSGAGPVEWRYEYAAEADATLLQDGDAFPVGEVRVRAMHTPGHTPEHLTFVLTDTATAPEPLGVFTGDFVFVGDVGRPDLLETAVGVAGAKEEGARALFASLQRFRALPEFAQVWPGHGAGSPCGRALGAVPQSTVGYETRYSWAFQVRDETEFVRAVLEGQPDAPAYFTEMKRVNTRGPAPVAALPTPAPLPPEALAVALEQGTVVVDTRSKDEYAGRHVPGALNIPDGSSFLTWAGALLPYDRPLALIAPAEGARDTVRRLRLIGLDDVVGYWTPDVLDAWESAGRAPGTVGRVEPAELRAMVERGAASVLDVRRRDEYAQGHIAGSRNIPLAQLKRRIGEVPAGRPVVVHCQGGLRSAIAASLLQSRGRADVLDLPASFGGWERAGQPVERDGPPPSDGAARE